MVACGRSWFIVIVEGCATTSVLHVDVYMVFSFDSLAYVDDACFGTMAGVLGFLAKRVPL